MATTAFVEEFGSRCRQALAEVNASEIQAVASVLLSAYERRARVFIVGNGGSASLASHLACDLEKTAAGPNPRAARRRLRAHALNDNMATLTAWANDEGYQFVFSEQLRAHADRDDVLVVISASGNSPSIVTALETAADIGLHTVALVGFDGGRAAAMANHKLHVRSHDYGVVEGTHGVLTHAITASLKDELSVRRAAGKTGSYPLPAVAQGSKA